MRKLASALIMAFSLLTTPALAAGFRCPAPQILPATLALGLTPTQQQLKPVQSYLTNLRAINAAFQTAARNPKRNEITNCLMDHLATLPNNASLLRPLSKADGATWFLLHAEVKNSLKTHARHLRHKPEMPAITNWLATQPQFVRTSPYSLATR